MFYILIKDKLADFKTDLSSTSFIFFYYRYVQYPLMDGT